MKIHGSKTHIHTGQSTITLIEILHLRFNQHLNLTQPSQIRNVSLLQYFKGPHFRFLRISFWWNFSRIRTGRQIPNLENASTSLDSANKRTKFSSTCIPLQHPIWLAPDLYFSSIFTVYRLWFFHLPSNFVAWLCLYSNTIRAPLDFKWFRSLGDLSDRCLFVFSSDSWNVQSEQS